MKNKILFLLTFLLFIPIVNATATTIEIHPTEINVDAGQYFNISLYVKPSEIINTVATDRIYWTPGTIECTETTQGTLFPDTVMFLGGKIDNTLGEIKNIVWGSHDQTETEGVFINLTFRALKGETDIVIDPAKFGIANNGTKLDGQISNSCHIKVFGEAEPINTTTEPTEIPLPVQYLIIIVIIAVLITFSILIIKQKWKEPKETEKIKEDPKKDENDIFH